MSDIIDEAHQREQQLLELALANRKKPEMVFTGQCRWCEDSITKGNYCSQECRDDHSRHVRAMAQKVA